jgi:hypothetical protein
VYVEENRSNSAAVANGIAALLLYLRDRTGHVPHAYLNRTGGNPRLYMIRSILSGYGGCRANNPRGTSSSRAEPRAPAAHPCPYEMIRRQSRPAGVLGHRRGEPGRDNAAVSGRPHLALPARLMRYQIVAYPVASSDLPCIGIVKSRLLCQLS